MNLASSPFVASTCLLALIASLPALAATQGLPTQCSALWDKAYLPYRDRQFSEARARLLEYLSAGCQSTGPVMYALAQADYHTGNFGEAITHAETAKTFTKPPLAAKFLSALDGLLVSIKKVYPAPAVADSRLTAETQSIEGRQPPVRSTVISESAQQVAPQRDPDTGLAANGSFTNSAWVPGTKDIAKIASLRQEAARASDAGACNPIAIAQPCPALRKDDSRQPNLIEHAAVVNGVGPEQVRSISNEALTTPQPLAEDDTSPLITRADWVTSLRAATITRTKSPGRANSTSGNGK